MVDVQLCISDVHRQFDDFIIERIRIIWMLFCLLSCLEEWECTDDQTVFDDLYTHCKS